MKGLSILATWVLLFAAHCLAQKMKAAGVAPVNQQKPSSEQAQLASARPRHTHSEPVQL